MTGPLPSAGQDLHVRPAALAEQRTALHLVLRDVPRARREDYISRVMQSGGVDRPMDGLFVAQRGGELAGAVWAEIHPGRVATLWPPVTKGAAATACAELLLAAAVAWLENGDVRVAQALAPLGEHDLAALLARHGFVPLAELQSMVSMTARLPASSPAAPLRFEPIGDASDDRLAAIVERTYEGTLDCPSLNGVREVHDVLATYRACGTFDPARWFFVCREDRRVGCLLLADHSDTNQWEILYAGLVPDERGRGSGLVLARHALWLAREARRASVFLAVDAANMPAVAAYARAGFEAYDRRQAFFRVFANAAPR